MENKQKIQSRAKGGGGRGDPSKILPKTQPVSFLSLVLRGSDVRGRGLGCAPGTSYTSCRMARF